MGIVAMMVAMDVITMGRSRILPASSIASVALMPLAFSWLPYSTNRIEFLVTIPTSRIIPIWLNRLSVEPASSRVTSAPVTARGTASNTVNGCTRDSNCAASTMYTATRASRNAKYSAVPLSSSSRDSPASATLLPRGSTSRAAAPSESSASPRVKPGARLPDSVNERTRLKWFSWRGPTPSSTVATWSSCTNALSRPRT